MAKNTKQIALMKQRHGHLSELPVQLNEAEFGFATDTNELFIGNPEHPNSINRVETNTFPYGNVQILTEYTENLKKIKYTYKSNTDVVAKLPVVIVGSKAMPSIAPKTSLKINTKEVYFANVESLSDIVNTVNGTPNLNVKAFVYNKSFIGFITTESEIVLEDGITYDKGIIERLGFGTESSYSESATTPDERTLQSVLDDYCSVRNYGALGDGASDDSPAIFNAIVSLNKAGDNAKYFRTLFIPSGTYIINERIIPLPKGTYLKGEGIGRTILKSHDILDSIITTMDSNMVMGNSNEYGYKSIEPSLITVQDLTLDVSDSVCSELLKLMPCHNIVFKNVEFIGNEMTTLVSISKNNYKQSYQHIVFDGCIFKNGENGIVADANAEHIVIQNCLFENIKAEAINLNPLDESHIVNSIIKNNIFKNCSYISKLVIHLNSNTEYVSVIDNKFDKDVIEKKSEIKTHLLESDLDYTDILDAKNSELKLLKFKFTQPMWSFIDYLTNPNGEYLVNAQYNKTVINGEEVVKNSTNSILLEQGDETNNDEFSIYGSNPTGDINYSSGKYGSIDLGKYGESTASYNNWEFGKEYKISDKVQKAEGRTYTIYECIKDHTSDESLNLDNNEYWKNLGVYQPKIVFHKNIDLHNNSIRDTMNNITFETEGDNVLIINDVKSTEEPYANRIASLSDAIPNVDFINKFGQTTITKVVNNEYTNQHSSNKIELVNFNSSMYGDFIYLDTVSFNVRRPYYNLQSRIKSALAWKSGLHYYVGDVVSVTEEKPNADIRNIKMFVYQNGQWQAIAESNILKLTAEDMDGTQLPLPIKGTDGQYAIYKDAETSERTSFYKNAGVWYILGSQEWSALFPSYAKGLSGKTYLANSIIEINGKTITLKGTTVDDAVRDINALFTDGSVVALNDNGALKITQAKGTLVIKDIKNGALTRLGFEANDETGVFIINKAVYNETISDTKPTSAVENSVLAKLESSTYFYACTIDHISFDFDEDAGRGGELVHWEEVYKQSINDATSQLIDLKDVKYVSIIATNGVDAERILFKRNTIDISKRNLDSRYEDDWVKGKSYIKGDRVLFKDRYYECLSNHTSKDEYDLNNPLLWLGIVEEGYNYIFNFERNIYKMDEKGNIITDNSLVTQYNYAGYKLYLEFYDENQQIVPLCHEVEDESKKIFQVNPSGYFITTIKYIKGY